MYYLEKDNEGESVIFISGCVIKLMLFFKRDAQVIVRVNFRERAEPADTAVNRASDIHKSDGRSPTKYLAIAAKLEAEMGDNNNC